MSHIKQLIENIFNSQGQVDVDSLKKLIYLAVNDTSSFLPYAKQIAELMSDALSRIEDDTLKLLVLQLLSEMATNYTSQISSDCYDFSQIIAFLSDENVKIQLKQAEVRKASHYLLLIFIKKYEKIDQILRGYLEKVKQNAEHWKKIQKIIHSFQSLLVIEPKCVTYGEDYQNMDDFLAMIIAYRAHQHALIQKASQQTVTSFVKNEYVPQIIGRLDKKLQVELAQFASKLNLSLSAKKQTVQYEQVQQIKINKKVERKKNELQILLYQIQNESDWKIKSDKIEQISKKIANQPNLDIPEDLVDKILDFTYDYNFKICITAMNIIFTLISSYPDQTQPKMKKIEDIIIDKICDLKMAVRQIAGKILKKIFSIQSKQSLKKLLNKLSNCSVVGKEQILNFLQQIYSTSPPIDLNLVLSEISNQFANENTRIKIKTLDCLVKISISNNVEECKLLLQRKLNKVYYDMFLDRLKEKAQIEQKVDKWDDKSFNKGMTWQADRSAPLSEPNDRFLTKVQFGRKNQKLPVQEETISDFKYQVPLKGRDLRDTKDQSKFNYGAVSTANCTANTFDTIKSEEVSSKAYNKKPIETYKPSAFSNFESSQIELSENNQQKKLPLKPNPVKKRPINNENVKQQEPPNSNLVIQSKQYRNKNNLDEIKQQKPAKSVRLAKGKQKQKIQDEQKYSERAKQPFSIKKSASKKQHQIDYKATQYITKEELAELDNPKQALKEITVNLPKDNDWSKQFDSLDILRRLLKNHEDIYPLIYQSLPTIMPEVLKLVDSLRSTLAKNGMITLSEMCECLKKAMDPFLDGIFIKLFRKAQDANTFIVEQVRKCMVSLCKYCTTSKICTIIINNSQAKAVPIKTKIALCIDKILQKQNYDLQGLRENQKLLGVMGNLITDSSSEVRNITKQIFLDICQNNSQQEVEAVFKKSSKDVWDKWKSILEKEIK